VIFLVEKLWGTLADPIVGAMSDRIRGGLGRRRSFILAGGIVFGGATLFLFFPSAAVTPLYLSLVLFAFYLGWSMIQIPFFAWSGEVSGNYNERTRVVTYQSVAGSIAILLVLVLPTLIDHFRPGNGVLKLEAMGTFILATLALGLVLTLRAFPEPEVRQHAAPRLSPAQAVRLVLTNRLLLRVLGSDFMVTLGQCIRAALFVFFVSGYMRFPQWASGLFLFQFIFGVAAGPIWSKVGMRLGKHHAAVLGELTQVAINLGLLCVTPDKLPLLLVLTVAQGFAQGSGNLMLRSMVADIADEHRLKTGVDRSGLFFSVFSISIKAAMAAAVGIALPLVGWLGFDPKAVHNSPEALRGLLLVFAMGPAIAHFVSAALIAGFPLDAKVHAEIRRKLTEHETRFPLTAIE
jgi:Na+/melibiose symporter-like transporter